MLQEQLKSLMYVECSLCGNTNKDKFVDELNFKNCMRFKRKTKRFFLLVLQSKEEILLFMWNV